MTSLISRRVPTSKKPFTIEKYENTDEFNSNTYDIADLNDASLLGVITKFDENGSDQIICRIKITDSKSITIDLKILLSTLSKDSQLLANIQYHLNWLIFPEG